MGHFLVTSKQYNELEEKNLSSNNIVQERMMTSIFIPKGGERACNFLF